MEVAQLTQKFNGSSAENGITETELIVVIMLPYPTIPIIVLQK